MTRSTTNEFYIYADVVWYRHTSGDLPLSDAWAEKIMSAYVDGVKVIIAPLPEIYTGEMFTPGQLYALRAFLQEEQVDSPLTEKLHSLYNDIERLHMGACA